MEESKEIQSVYKIFRTLVYVSLMLEFFVYAMPYQALSALGPLCMDFHDRLSQMLIYRHGNLAYSKLATLLMVVITCIGTRNKKAYQVRREAHGADAAGLGDYPHRPLCMGV